FFFFFSSRRRHTRWPRDWSSDVCSSDLMAERSRISNSPPCRSMKKSICSRRRAAGLAKAQEIPVSYYPSARRQTQSLGRRRSPRSEERRVGKECGGRRGRER